MRLITTQIEIAMITFFVVVGSESLASYFMLLKTTKAAMLNFSEFRKM